MRRIFLLVLILISFGLLAGCASLNAADSLHNAAEVGDINAVKDHLKKGVDVNARDSVGWTALMRAVSYGHTEIVKVLIAKGADVNVKGFEGWTPLIGAIRKGDTEIAKILIAKGADIDAAITGLEGFAINDPRFASEYKYGISLLKRLRPQEEIAHQPAIPSPKLSQENYSVVKSDVDSIPDFKTASRENDLAIIIGIEKYQGLPKSDYSKSDAGVVKDYLKALGFQERNIEFVTDERATKSKIETAIEGWLPNKVKKDSRVVVYYSGHGAPDPSKGEAYIVPYDGDPNYLTTSGYSLKRLYDNLGKLQAAEVIVLLDSCFSGAGGRSVLAKGARPLVMMTDVSVISSNMAVLSATQGTQISTSSTEKGHGVFTYYFLKALKDGKKNIAEIYEYIRPLVEDEAKQMNVQQSPSISPE